MVVVAGCCLLPVGAAAQQAQQQTLCVRFAFQAEPTPKDAENSARRQTAFSRDWLTRVMGGPVSIAPCGASATAVVATLDELIYNRATRVYSGMFTIPPVRHGDWSDRVTYAWEYTFDAREECDTEQFFALVSAIIDYRLENKQPVPANLERNLGLFSRQQRCTAKVRLGSAYEALKERLDLLARR